MSLRNFQNYRPYYIIFIIFGVIPLQHLRKFYQYIGRFYYFSIQILLFMHSLSLIYKSIKSRILHGQGIDMVSNLSNTFIYVTSGLTHGVIIFETTYKYKFLIKIYTRFQSIIETCENQLDIKLNESLIKHKIHQIAFFIFLPLIAISICINTSNSDSIQNFNNKYFVIYSFEIILRLKLILFIIFKITFVELLKEIMIAFQKLIIKINDNNNQLKNDLWYKQKIIIHDIQIHKELQIDLWNIMKNLQIYFHSLLIFSSLFCYFGFINSLYWIYLSIFSDDNDKFDNIFKTGMYNLYW